jgi:hypothetical protein
MKISLKFVPVAVILILGIAAFHKNSSGPSAGYGPQSLFPTTTGDTWYYKDSTFNDSALMYESLDTMVATSHEYQDASGTIYLEMNNPNGWFDGSYIAVDPTNYAVYEVDSPAFEPYTMFATVSADGPIGPTSYDYSNPACPISYNQYGYANPINIDGYSCYLNSEVVMSNCTGSIVLEQTNFYLSPGVGVVRIEDYLTDTTGGLNKYYEDYSETLTSEVLKPD